MLRRGRRWMLVAWGLASCGHPGVSQARPFRVDDYLSLETFRQAFVSADGRRAAVAWGAASERAAAFDNDLVAEASLGRVLLLDDRGAGRSPLLRRVPGCRSGCRVESFSPSGKILALSRLRDRRLELGVLRGRDTTPVWLGVSVAPASLGRRLQWLSDEELLVLSPAPGQTPVEWRAGAPTYADTLRLWRTQARGGLAVRRIGSGVLEATPLRPLVDLIRVDVLSGRHHVEARGSYDDLEIAPRQRFVALTGPAADVPLKSQTHLDYDDITPRRRLTIVDLRRKRSWSPCAACDVTSTLMTWSPATPDLLVFARRDPSVSWRDGRFLQVSPLAGSVRELTGPTERPALQVRGDEHQTYALGGWLGRDPLLFLSGPSGRPDWYRITASGDRNLTADLAPPTPRLGRFGDLPVIAAGSDVAMIDAAGRPRPSPGFPSRSWQAETGLRGYLNPPASQGALPSAKASDGSAPQLVAQGARWRLELATAISGVQTLTYVASDRRQAVIRLNRGLAAIDPPIALALPCRDPARAGLADWLFLPPQLPAGRAAPLIVIPYPGAVHQRDGAPEAAPDNPQNARVLVGAGFAVLVPSVPRALDAQDPDADLSRHVSHAVDAAVATGRVDPSKVAIWGHSFGGFAALRLAEQSHRFSAVIAQSGASDFASFRGVFTPQVRIDPADARRRDANTAATEAGQVALRGSPWEAPQHYVDKSPLFAADKISTPLLLIYCDQDFISVTQGEEVFSALHRLGKDAELMTFFGEGHVPASPANVRQLYRRIEDFTRWSFGRPPLATRVPPMP